MIKDFIPPFDEAAALEDENKWALKQPNRAARACEVINTKGTPADLTHADAETLDQNDEEFINSLRDRK